MFDYIPILYVMLPIFVYICGDYFILYIYIYVPIMLPVMYTIGWARPVTSWCTNTMNILNTRVISNYHKPYNVGPPSCKLVYNPI